MKTITLNRRQIKVSAEAERALRTLANDNFAATRNSFVENSGPRRWRHKRFTLPSILTDWSGVYEVSKGRASTARERAFFEAHPRCQSGIFARVRTVKAILAKLDRLT